MSTVYGCGGGGGRDGGSGGHFCSIYNWVLVFLHLEKIKAEPHQGSGYLPFLLLLLLSLSLCCFRIFVVFLFAFSRERERVSLLGNEEKGTNM